MGGWCDNHYDALAGIRKRDMVNATRRAHGNVEIAINLLRSSMRFDPHRYERIAYEFLIRRWTTANYGQIVSEYFTDPCRETRVALFEEFPQSLPTDQKWALLDDIVASSYWQQKSGEINKRKTGDSGSDNNNNNNNTE